MSNNDDWSLLKRLIIQAVHTEQLDTLLRFILTPEECQALPKRVVLIKNLLAGHTSQRAIAEKTGISIAKITRGSNELKRIDTNFKQWLVDQLHDGVDT